MKIKSWKIMLLESALFLPILTVISCSENAENNKDEDHSLLIQKFKDSFNKIQTTEKKHLSVAHWTSDSELLAEDLGIKEPDIKLEIPVRYDILQRRHNEGELMVNANLKHFSKTDNFVFSLRGFTIDENDKDAFNTIKEFIDQINEIQETSFNNRQASEFSGENNSLAYLGIKNLKNKNKEILINKHNLKIAVDVESNNSIAFNNEEGTLKAIIKVSKENNDNVISKKEITIKNFLTNTEKIKQENQEVVNEILNQFKSVIETTRKETLVKDINGPINADTIGIDEPQNKKGTFIQYQFNGQITNKNKEEGTLNINVIVSKGEGKMQVHSSKEIQIFGFKSSIVENKIIVKEIKELLNNKIFETKYQTTLPSHLDINNENIFEKLGIKLDQNKLNIINEKLSLANLVFTPLKKDNEKGIVEIKAIINKGSIPNIIEDEAIFQVIGYETNNKLFDRIQDYIAGFNEENAFDLDSAVNVNGKFQELVEVFNKTFIKIFSIPVFNMIKIDIEDNKGYLWGKENVDKIFSADLRFQFWSENQYEHRQSQWIDVFWTGVKFDEKEREMYDCFNELKKITKGVHISNISGQISAKIVDKNWKRGEYLNREQLIELLGANFIPEIPATISFKAEKYHFEENSKDFTGQDIDIFTITITIQTGNLQLEIVGLKIGFEIIN